MHFVFLSEHPWDSLSENAAKNLAIAISERFPVLFINPPKSRLTQDHNNQIQYYKQNLEIHWPTSLLSTIASLPQWFIPKLQQFTLRKLGTKLLKRTIKLSPNTPFILVNNCLWASEINLSKTFRPAVNMFLLNSALTGSSSSSHKLTAQLAKCCRTSDLVIASCTYLSNQAGHYTSKVVTLHEGAFHRQQYQQLANSSELLKPRQPQQPTIGYLGPLDKNFIDLALLKRLCARTTDYQYKLLLTAIKSAEDLEDLSLPNVETMLVNGESIPSRYLEQIDVALFPLASSYEALAGVPVEMFTLMAMGKPVIVSKTINTQPFENYVNLAYGDSQYLAALREVIYKPDIDKLAESKQFAKTMTWENVALKLYQHIYNYTGEVLIP